MGLGGAAGRRVGGTLEQRAQWKASGNGQVVREAEGRRAKQRATEEGQSFKATPPTGRMSGFTYNKVKPVNPEHVCAWRAASRQCGVSHTTFLFLLQ